jgi:isopenicillin-N N-acyltransferase-like protein
LDELRGIADGAGVSLNDIILLNSRYDLARIRGFSGLNGSKPLSSPSENGKETSDEAHVNGLNVQDAVDKQNGIDNSHAGSHEDDYANECTSGIFLPSVTSDGSVIVAQNWDMSGQLYLNDTAVYLEVHPDPSEDLPSMLLMTEAGQLGRSGINSAGLAVCANSLMSTEDYLPYDFTPHVTKQNPLLPMSLVRRAFLHNKSFSAALITVQNAPRHVSNHIGVSTAEGFGMSLEITPSEIHIIYPSAADQHGFVTHGNHFVSPSFDARGYRDRYPGGSSWFRAERVAQGIRPFAAFRGLTPARIKEAFSDHLSCPSSVCQHMEKLDLRNVPDYPYKGLQITVAFLLYNLTERTLWTCKGPPCMGKFIEIKLDDKQETFAKLKST